MLLDMRMAEGNVVGVIKVVGGDKGALGGLAEQLL
jgi:hypothetical protein